LQAVGGNFQQQVQFLNVIASLRSNIEQQITTQQQTNNAQTHLQELQNNQQVFNQRLQQNQQLAAQQEIAINDARSQAETALNQIAGEISFDNLFNFAIPGQRTAAAPFIQNIQNAQTQLRNALQDFALTGGTANRTAVQNALVSLREQLQAFNTEFSGILAQNVFTLGVPGGGTVQGRLTTIENAINSIGNSQFVLNEANDEIANANTQLQQLGQNALQAIPQQFINSLTTSNTQTAQLATNFAQARTNVLSLIDSVNQLNGAIRNLPAIPAAPGAANVPGFQHGGLIT